MQGDIARGTHFGCNGSGYSEELSYTLNTMDVPVVTQRPAGANPEAAAIELCPSQTASQGKTPPVICVADSNARSAIDVELAGSLKVGGDVPCVAINCRNYDVTTEMSGTLLAKPNGGFSMNYQNPIFSGEYEPGDPFWYVACLECGAEGPHGETPEDACKLWDAKHGRHRIGVRYTQPMCADAAACAAAPATATPAEIEKERARKQRFYDLAGGLLKPGA